ncbi:RagB/SusD family nutrient uptake outer membrane protein [Parapedobacter sp. SGR-10]|uniref:RagB/SusD family nutrient uptake outer membrane protein n=1 Tax=Parapedobacter sp. SGR-10 TaxID=2710879 RepID=UPI0013D88DB1|nr:RagB/SusD family nutrient uptake outer membrane protein [Parapedobacter sp. SGR-10]NGF57151.1 RagB/SusD family nutrient uptake outer membrane protein [Parapedobacter sp. SGR-10]
MKNLLYIISVCMISLSCTNFLETEPTDFSSPDDFYNTEDQLNQALSGVYTALAKDGTYARNLPVELALNTDEAFYKKNFTTYTNPAQYNYDAATPIIAACWKTLYEGINRANYLLANAHIPKMDETKRNVIKGEAMFLRAYYYFILVSMWGDVPLILEPTLDGKNVNIPKTPQREIYSFILREMTAAQSMVDKISDIGFSGRASKTTMQGILARVCLKMAGEPLKDVSKYELARAWADSVITSNEHELNADYTQIFKNHSSDQYDIKESMWEVEFWGNNLGNAYRAAGRIGNQFSIRTTHAEMYGYANVGATKKLFQLYTDPNDVRRDWNVAPFKYENNNTLIPVPHGPNDVFVRDAAKWRRDYETVLPRNVDFSPTNFPLLRYADVLLMYAEAENELNGPSDDAHEKLNMVRRRANAYEYVGANKITDKDDFRDTIIDERSRELCFEGLRKFDLIRWGKELFLGEMRLQQIDFENNAPTSPNMKEAHNAYGRVSERHLLFPIPASELSINKAMTQNKGW